MVAGALTVVKVTETNSTIDPFPQVLSLCLYIVIVCGILSFLRDPKSIDVKFPTGMNVFISVLVLIVFLNGPAADGDPGMCALFAIGGLPYGIFLLVLNVRRIKRREFSISILVYHLGSWLGWTAMWTLWCFGAAGAL